MRVLMAASSARNRFSLQTLENIVDPADVQAWEVLTATQQARIGRSLAPGAQVGGMVSPKTEADLAAVIATADQQNWRVLPCGSGSKLDWGGLVQAADVLVSTQQLHQLIDHAVGDLTVTVEAGFRFADLQALLAKAGQFLAIDPAFPEAATIGGIIVTADTGSLRQRYNSIRDMLLGLSLVRADGKIAKAGGRVVKNVAGYDLMKLFTGSYGTLGIISQVTLRVYPLPEASQTVVLSGEADAIAQATATLHSSALTPAAADILSSSVIQELAIGQGTGLIVRFQSISASVEQQSSRLIEVGQALNLAYSLFSQADETALWQQLQQRITVANQEGLITCKIGVRPSDATAVLRQIDHLEISSWAGQVHMASGLGRLVFDDAIQPEVLLKVRALCQSHDGFLSILQAPTVLKQTLDVWGYTGNALDLMRRLKQQFDPKALLSPQRFVGGI